MEKKSYQNMAKIFDEFYTTSLAAYVGFFENIMGQRIVERVAAALDGDANFPQISLEMLMNAASEIQSTATKTAAAQVATIDCSQILSTIPIIQKGICPIVDEFCMNFPYRMMKFISQLNNMNTSITLNNSLRTFDIPPVTKDPIVTYNRMNDNFDYDTGYLSMPGFGMSYLTYASGCLAAGVLYELISAKNKAFK